MLIIPIVDLVYINDAARAFKQKNFMWYQNMLVGIDNTDYITFINLDTSDSQEKICDDKNLILKYLRDKMTDLDTFEKASSYSVKDLWNGDTFKNEDGRFEVSGLKACDTIVWRIYPQ